MSILDPLDDARRALALAPGETDAAAIKQAYRRAVAAHPPDVDPEGFRRVRDAYELLREPWARLEALLLSRLPMTPPPAPPAEVPSPPPGTTAVALLRLSVQMADTSEWAAPPKRPRRKAA